MPRAAPAEARCAGFIQTGLCPEPPASARGDPMPRAAPAEARCAGFIQTGLCPGPPASACGDPIAPRRSRRGALCGLHSDGALPRTPGVRLRGPHAPRRSRRGALCGLHSDGALPRTPGVRLRGPHRPAPLPPRRAVRALRRLRQRCHQTGLCLEPPASACGDPIAPRRSRRGALCAPCGICTDSMAQTPWRTRPGWRAPTHSHTTPSLSPSRI